MNYNMDAESQELDQKIDCNTSLDSELQKLERFLNSVEKQVPLSPNLEEKEKEENDVKQMIATLFSKYDGLVLGGNDFLYTKELTSHPCSYFLYHFGLTLVENGLDTIFLENHYLIENIQTRGLIGHVMYCAYLYNLRVIGLEGKFTPEEYKKFTGKVIEAPWTTVAFQTKKRIDRLNIVTKDIVEYCKKGKYLLFCGMSHVNDETHVTTCKGIKTFLNVPGCGASFAEKYAIIPNKPFVDHSSGYRRNADYMIEVYQDKTVDKSLYINSLIYCMVHDYLFFYKTVRNVRQKQSQKFKSCSVKQLWNHNTTIYPPIYRLYAEDAIRRDERLLIPVKSPHRKLPWEEVYKEGNKITKKELLYEYEEYKEYEADELDDLCSYIHSLLKDCKAFPSRADVVKAMEPVTDEQLFQVVDIWVAWMKKTIGHDTLKKFELDAISDIIFLEYKKLSLEDDEESYISYIKNKFVKQLERPEHKLFTLFRIMESLHIPIHTNKLMERLIHQFRATC